MPRTTIELNQATLEKAEIFAANRGITLNQLVAELLDQHVVLRDTKEFDKPWMLGFGELTDLADENRRILNLIEEEFGVVEKGEPE